MVTPTLTDADRELRRRLGFDPGPESPVPGPAPNGLSEADRELRRKYGFPDMQDSGLADMAAGATPDRPPAPIPRQPAVAPPPTAGSPSLLNDFLSGVGRGFDVSGGAGVDALGFLTDAFSAFTNFARPGLAFTPLSELANQRQVEVTPELRALPLPDRLLAQEQAQPFLSQLMAGIVTDPTLGIPGIGVTSLPRRAAAPVARAGGRRLAQEVVEAMPTGASATFPPPAEAAQAAPLAQAAPVARQAVEAITPSPTAGAVLEMPGVRFTRELREGVARLDSLTEAERVAKAQELYGVSEPDLVYRTLMSTGARAPLKPGETWRSRVLRFAGEEPQTAGAMQAGMGIGERPPQGELFPEAPTAATAQPLADPQQLLAEQARQEELARGQLELPRTGAPAPETLPASPLEAAQMKLDEAQAHLEATQARGAPVPKFGTRERAEFDNARRLASAEGKPVLPKAQRVREARQRLQDAQAEVTVQRNALATRQMSVQDAVEAAVGPAGGPPGPVSPSGSPIEDGLHDILGQFRAFLQDPSRADEWQQTLLERSRVLAERSKNVRAQMDLLVSQGLDTETAMGVARSQLAGVLPTVKTPLHQLASPTVREALFQEVYLSLADEPLEMVSTAEALSNALLGRAIPRTPGMKGGSAYSRLTRVFGDDLAKTLTQQRSLEEIIALQTRGGLGQSSFRPAPGPFISMPGTQTFGSRTAGAEQFPMLGAFDEPPLLQPQQSLRPEPPPGPFREMAPDPRSQAQKDIDLQVFKELTGEASPPTGVTDPRALDFAGIPPDTIVRAPGYIPRSEKDRMLAWAKTAGLTAIDLGNLIRANVATVDLSYLRQQALLIPGHPVAFAKSFKDALRGIFSADYAKQIDQWIKSDPDYKYYDLAQTKQVYHPSQVAGEAGTWEDVPKGGRDFLRPLDATTGKNGRLIKEWERAEEFIIKGGNRPLQKLADKLPWINISSRAYITGINSMNWHIYKGYLKTLHRQQEQIAAGLITLKPGESFSVLKEADSLASMLADMSGRGPVGPLKELTPALNAGLFSLRTNIGRFISPRHLFSQDKWTRGEAWKNFLTAIGAMSSVILGGREMGWWDVETDSRSSDFMKVRVGNTRIDIWGGYQQYAVLYGRLLPLVGGLKSTETGAISEIEPVSGGARFLRNKASPALSQALMAWTGKDFKGSKIDRADWRFWIQQNAPLTVQTVIDAFQDQGLVGLALGAPAALGIGIQEHERSLNSIAQERYGMDYDDLPERVRKQVRAQLLREQTPEQRRETLRQERESEQKSRQREIERGRQFQQRGR